MRHSVLGIARRALIGMVLCSLCSTGLSQALHERPVDPYARDLLILTDWFEGEFDNEAQLWLQADPRSKTPETDRHPRVHTMHRRLDLPEFGQHVFYVEEYRDNDPAEVIRQRFVVFSSGGAKGKIRMRQGFFRDAKSALGAQYEPERLADLQKDDVFFLDACDVYWERVANQYEGQMAPKACVFGEGDKRRYSVHDMVLSEDKYWRVDMTRLVSNDQIHVGLPEGNPTRMRRAIPFICEMNLRLGDGSAQRVADLRLHNQGGVVEVTREDDGQVFQIRLRDKQYPFYQSRPDFLFLAVRQPGVAQSVAYSVGDADSRRLGVNVPGIGVHCHRAGYDFRQTSDQLTERFSG